MLLTGPGPARRRARAVHRHHGGELRALGRLLRLDRRDRAARGVQRGHVRRRRDRHRGVRLLGGCRRPAGGGRIPGARVL